MNAETITVIAPWDDDQSMEDIGVLYEISMSASTPSGVQKQIRDIVAKDYFSKKESL